MKSLVLTTAAYTQDTSATDPMSSEQTERGNVIVRHKRMQQGLLAKAAQYANNATRTAPLPAGSQFNDILMAKRDPIVWGDASNRYNYRRTEINNNELNDVYRTSPVMMESSNKFPSSAMIDGDVRTELKHPSENGGQEPDTFGKNDTVKFESVQLLQQPDDSRIHNERISEKSSPMPQNQAQTLSFNSTQQLRSGFFRSIKRQYPPLLPSKDTTKAITSSGNSACDSDSSSAVSNFESLNDNENNDEADVGYNSMSILARQKLEQLRKRGPKNVDVPTGLQWIRLELHEMREQDKTLFLQLIKLHSTIKDLRADFTDVGEFDSYDDLHSADSLWWPRRGYNLNVLPDFSSSDGAQLMRSGKPKPLLRRGFSLNYPPIASPRRCSPDTSFHDGSLPSSANGSQGSMNLNLASVI